MATATKRKPAKKKTASKRSPRKWSKKVNETSNAMDLKKGVFTSGSPKKMAASVKRSAEKSKRKKAGPFQSAMSMLNFYQNRGGKNLSAGKKKQLIKAKEELRKLFGKDKKTK
jgi:hypothetical protein